MAPVRAFLWRGRGERAGASDPDEVAVAAAQPCAAAVRGDRHVPRGGCADVLRRFGAQAVDHALPGVRYVRLDESFGRARDSHDPAHALRAAAGDV